MAVAEGATLISAVVDRRKDILRLWIGTRITRTRALKGSLGEGRGRADPTPTGLVHIRTLNDHEEAVADQGGRWSNIRT